MKLSVDVNKILKRLLIIMVLFGFGSVLFVFFQSAIDLIITVLLLLLIIINKTRINQRLFFSILVVVSFCFLHALIVNVPVSNYFTLIYRFLIAVLIVSVFENDYSKLKQELYYGLRFFCYLALANLVIIHILPSSFFTPQITDSGGYFVRTLGYIFNLSSIMEFGALQIYRNPGAFWEPGVLQILINFLIYIELFERGASLKKVIIPIIVLISTFSTTGFLILGILLFAKYRNQIKFDLRGIAMIISGVVVFMLIGFALLDKVSYKGKEVKEDSFLLRTYDTYMTSKIAIDHWATGMGYSVDKMKEERSKRKVSFLGYRISMERGSTNAFVQHFAYFGLIFGFIYFHIVYKQNLFIKRKVIFLIWILSLNSEPVIFTTLSWIIFVSGLDYKRVDLKLN